MIDNGDGDFFLLLSAFSKGWWAIVLFLLAIGLYVIANNNETDCEKRTCPISQTAKLIDHECVCVTPAK